MVPTTAALNDAQHIHQSWSSSVYDQEFVLFPPLPLSMVYSPPAMSLPRSTQGVALIPSWFGVRTAAFSVIIMPDTMMASAAMLSVIVGSLFDPLAVALSSTGSPVSAPSILMAKQARSSTCPPKVTVTCSVPSM